MRNINCSGSGKYVYPSAVHSYFNKSIGLYLKVSNYSEKLKLNQTESNILNIAALGYNIGRMPYSKAFYNFMNEDLGIIDYNHEDTSLMLLQNNEKINLNDEEFDLLTSIIKGDYQSLPDNQKYLSMIINNKQSFIDFIKINDIERDNKYYGLSEGIDLVHINDVKVIDGNLIYNEKVRFALLRTFLYYTNISNLIINMKEIFTIIE